MEALFLFQLAGYIVLSTRAVGAAWATIRARSPTSRDCAGTSAPRSSRTSPSHSESGTSEADVCARNTSREAEVVVAPEMNNVAAHWQALLAALPWVRILRLHLCGPPSVSVLSALASSADLLLCASRMIFWLRILSDARPHPYTPLCYGTSSALLALASQAHTSWHTRIWARSWWRL